MEEYFGRTYQSGLSACLIMGAADSFDATLGMSDITCDGWRLL